jgi:metal-responsive CopG/Arc/MetJ family transcriptional regulator
MAKRTSGGQPRAGVPARNRLVVLLTDTELAQLDAYVAKHGRDRSHWVRKALQKIGALARSKT